MTPEQRCLLFSPKAPVLMFKLTSPAIRTTIWYLLGVDPTRIKLAVVGNLFWTYPKPFKQVPTFEAEYQSEGKFPR